MFRGEEDQCHGESAVLHVALRAPKGQSIMVDCQDVCLIFHVVLDKWPGFPTG